MKRNLILKNEVGSQEINIPINSGGIIISHEPKNLNGSHINLGFEEGTSEIKIKVKIVKENASELDFNNHVCLGRVFSEDYRESFTIHELYLEGKALPNKSGKRVIKIK